MPMFDDIFGDYERERIEKMNTPEALAQEKIANERRHVRFLEEQQRAERYRLEHPEEFKDADDEDEDAEDE